MRKLIVGLLAMGFVALMFLAYALLVDKSPAIKMTESRDVPDMQIPEPTSSGKQQTGDKIGGMEEAKYVKYDPITKEIEIVYGFKSLMNPGDESTRWEVSNPYLIFHQSDYKCRIDSDTGTFQMESGGSDTLRDAQLDGNVVIHIIPESTKSGVRETYIEMDDLTFSSERSEFSTDGPVNIKSEQGKMDGTGMVLLFDTVTGKIDYLNIRDLTELRIFETPDTEPTEEVASVQSQPGQTVTSPVQTSPSVLSPPSVQQPKKEKKAIPPSEFYQCILEDNVVIEYGNKLIVAGADQVNIQNIVISGFGESKKKNTSPQSADAAVVPNNTSPAVSVGEQSIEQGVQNEPEPEKDSGFSEEVVVRCDGGIILKPMIDDKSRSYSAVVPDLSVEMRGAPIQIDKVISGEQSVREPLVSCGLLTYTPMEDILRLFTHEQQRQIVLNAEQSNSRIETLGNVWWDRKGHHANIAGPGIAYLLGSDVSKEPAEVSFNDMDLIFAQTPDLSDSPAIQTINLTGGMDAVFKQNGWYETIADSARLEFGQENTLSQAHLLGEVEFKSLEKEKPQRALSDSATFEFGPENALTTAHMKGDVLFESSEEGKQSRAVSDEATFYFDNSKISSADLNGDVRVSSDTATMTSPDATIAFAPDESGAMQPAKVHTKGEAMLETIPEAKDAPPARFEARRIDYDLQTGAGLAYGPVHFRFYQPADEGSSNKEPWIPVTVTADENAIFVADESKTVKQVVFNGNVLASRMQEMPGFVQLDDLHGDKLTVDLHENELDKTEISRITMSEGNVYAQSQKLRGQEIVSNVKLDCSEVIFNEIENQVLAKGPGEIQMDNSNVTPTQSASDGPGVNTSSPCYVLVEGFDLIQWDLNQQKIVADGQKDQLKLAYIPLIYGAPEKYVYVSSMRFDLYFGSDQNGKSDLQRVYTDQGITYEEKDKRNDKTLHIITGQTLDYDRTSKNGWVKIEGTPAMPVNADGFRTPYVYVHPATGKVDTSISTMPGVMPEMSSPKNK